MLPLLLLVAGAASTAAASGDGCRVGCPLALAAYYFSADSNLTFIASLFGFDYTALLPYNPAITDSNYIVTGVRVSVPFRCSCLALLAAPGSTTYLAGSLPPYAVSRGETYDDVASEFANLTTSAWLKATNAGPSDKVPGAGTVNVTVNCSCGDERVSPRYGLFITYPLWDGETLASAAELYGFSSPAQMELLRRYNPGMDGVSGKGIVFIPVKDPNGSYHPLESGNNLSGGAVAGIVIACIVVFVMVIWLFAFFYRQHKFRQPVLLPSPDEPVQLGNASQAEGIKVDRSIVFSYKELFNATQGFNMDHKIGQGGFGAVYYAELQGEKAAIKKMDTQATQEFLAELKVLTHVHHLNLVRLIGYCVENCLFLVYEFIENGNLSQHLCGTGYEPLSWATRVRIALDSARGLEYIHEHTVPAYVHRDIKSANILIDKDFRAKCLAGCRFWTNKACRNWRYITASSYTSCWYIWLHASRVSPQSLKYLWVQFSLACTLLAVHHRLQFAIPSATAFQYQKVI
ncbi:lysM domain receptor-like kinase 10 isoform X2 [Phragmites australis]|uniref:lysM domain receptor-like kinase 10 isoform X2 n=1 Tax=Phragmites australis TaxID=29695 RepID=UPI002D79032D|nr:lysM domain receptor-like kinase 10 isoform X2 [Phragmites australis]